MKKLYIHLGTGKTGTTAIQSFLTINRERLLSAGVNYCLAGFEGINHHFLCYNFNRTESKFRVIVKDNLELLGEEIDLSPCDRHIVSSEYFPDVTEQEIHDMVHRLSPYCEVNVVVYFRRQDHFLESWYAQVVKAGAIDSDIHALRHQLESAKIFDYAYHASKWASLIGKDRVKVRPYEKCQFVGGSIFSDFLSTVGVEFSAKFESIRHDPNPSLPRSQLYLARQLAPLLETSDLSILLKPIPELETLSSKFFLPPLERINLLEKYTGINNFVADEYLGKQVLFEDMEVADLDFWEPLGYAPLDYVRRFLDFIAAESGVEFARIRAALESILDQE